MNGTKDMVHLTRCRTICGNLSENSTIAWLHSQSLKYHLFLEVFNETVEFVVLHMWSKPIFCLKMLIKWHCIKAKRIKRQYGALSLFLSLSLFSFSFSIPARSPTHASHSNTGIFSLCSDPSKTLRVLSWQTHWSSDHCQSHWHQWQVVCTRCSSVMGWEHQLR